MQQDQAEEHSGALHHTSQVHTTIKQLQQELADSTAAFGDERQRLSAEATANKEAVDRLAAEVALLQEQLSNERAALEERLLGMEVEHKQEMDDVQV